MKRLPFLVAFGSTLALLATGLPASAQLRLGSTTAARIGAWTLDGAAMTDTRAKLESPANFGVDGTFPVEIQITDVASTLTPAVLAPFDAYFAGYQADGTLSASEETALMNWVSDGGRLILGCDDTFTDEICEAFGRSLGGVITPPTLPAPGQSGELPFTGPFGVASTLANHSNGSYFASAAGGLVLAVDSMARPVVIADFLGDGLVIYLSDIDLISNATLSNGATIHPDNDNDAFLGNLFAALAFDSCPADSLCLGDHGRFRVTTTWRTKFATTGIGHPVPLTADTGAFWFFGPDNLEMIIKVLDACVVNGHYWVFAGGLTDVEVDITVTDTEAPQTRMFHNPLNTPFQPVQATNAFATCP